MGNAACAILFRPVQADGGFHPRHGGHAHGDFLHEPHPVFPVPDPARGRKPPLEIKCKTKTNPVSRAAPGGKSVWTWPRAPSSWARCW